MRPIKFRGKARDGQYYYGDLINEYGAPTIRMSEDSNTYYIDVYPESVAQHVGYDADGREVYEDDILIDEFDVEVDDFVEVLGRYNLGDKFHGYELKK